MTKLKYYWHIHHSTLLEPLTEPLGNRIEYIKKYKPEDEQELRLKLIKPVKGKIPIKVAKAGKASDKAWTASDKAWEASVKARKAYDKVREASAKVREAYAKAWEAYVKTLNSAAIKKLHKKQCGCFYDFKRKTIFTRGNGFVK